MGAKARGHKPLTFAFRGTQRHAEKLERLAIIRDGTVSDVLRELVDSVAVDLNLSYQNSNAGGVRQDMTTGIAH